MYTSGSTVTNDKRRMKAILQLGGGTATAFTLAGQSFSPSG